MSYIDAQFAELHSLVADLGKDGGLISPSIYDTAQVIRLHPPPEGTEPAITWLLDQQQADGGWGEPEAPYARDVPTLATVLALHVYSHNRQTAAAIDAGLTFLRRQAEQWCEIPVDAMPVAVEMTLPRLIREANAVGLQIDPNPYQLLYKLGERKCHFIQKSKPAAGSPPVHSWEAWGQEADTSLADETGGIGHSPSATAAWLQQMQRQPVPVYHELWTKGQRYLQKAAASTRSGIPGVVPNVWPITGFEKVYGPYALFITSLFTQPQLQDVLQQQIADLQLLMERKGGVSFGEAFAPDVDDTALGMIALHMTKHPVDINQIRQFKSGNHYYTFQAELNPSVFSNAHALYALSLLGEIDVDTEAFLLQQQADDGRWLADKWHSSWIYTTLEVVLALSRLGYKNALGKTVATLLNQQQPDGGWGADHRSSQVETSYAVLALHHFHRLGVLNEYGIAALKRGHAWLTHHYRPYTLMNERYWLGKELYTPYRVDRIYVLCANLIPSWNQEETCLPNTVLA